MNSFDDNAAFDTEQGIRVNSLFSAVVLTALDDAILQDKKYGNGHEQMARWARSRDGRIVLSCAGIDLSELVVKRLIDFVVKGERTSAAICRAGTKARLLAAVNARTHAA